MAYKITSRVPIIKAQNNAAIPLALRFFLDDIHRRALPITPRLTGDLSGNVTKTVLGTKGIISWVMVYASYQERGMRYDGTRVVQKYTTPGTGPKYSEKAVHGSMADAVTIFRKAGVY